jgi:hypothetical protein
MITNVLGNTMALRDSVNFEYHGSSLTKQVSTGRLLSDNHVCNSRICVSVAASSFEWHFGVVGVNSETYATNNKQPG